MTYVERYVGAAAVEEWREGWIKEKRAGEGRASKGRGAGGAREEAEGLLTDLTPSGEGLSWSAAVTRL